MGFNNRGIDPALARVAKAQRRGILGINVRANKESNDRIGDYRIGVARAAPRPDYVRLNIGSPNTPGLRALHPRPTPNQPQPPAPRGPVHHPRTPTPTEK